MARDRAQRNRDAVPQIDHGHGQREIHNFLFAEMFLYLGENLIRHMRLGHVGGCFGPSQGGAFTVVKEGRFTPGIQGIQPLLAFTFRARVNL